MLSNILFAAGFLLIEKKLEMFSCGAYYNSCLQPVSAFNMNSLAGGDMTDEMLQMQCLQIYQTLPLNLGWYNAR